MPTSEYKHAKCKECQSHNLILEHETNYIICLECGLIQNYYNGGLMDYIEKRNKQARQDYLKEMQEKPIKTNKGNVYFFYV